MMSTPTEWLTSSQTAALLGVDRSTVKRLAPTELPYFQHGDRGWRKYRRTDVLAYLERRMVR
jgi:hypothetical protein